MLQPADFTNGQVTRFTSGYLLGHVTKHAGRTADRAISLPES
jgi:hypothetical protein